MLTPAHNKTYGAFFGVIVLLFWLFLSAFVALYAELELQTRRTRPSDHPSRWAAGAPMSPTT